jgi:glycosyltransferase involved in cell wall biosynthesis
VTDRAPSPVRAPPGSLGLCILGGAVGAFLAVVGEALVWIAAEGRDPAAAVGRVAGGWTGQPLLLACGFVAGLLGTGVLVGNPLVSRILLLLRRGAQLALGAALGALGGTLAYALVWLATAPGATLDGLLGWLAQAPATADDPYILFLWAGAAAGILGAAFALGQGPLRSLWRVLAGAAVGGLAGLVLYSVAYVLVYYPEAPQGAEYVLRFAEAVGSFTASELVAVGLAAVAGAVLSGYSWRLYGILTFLSLLFVVLGYALHTLTVTLPSVPPGEATLSRLLFAAELTSLLMVLLYSFYTIDVAARKRWRRTTEDAVFSPFFLPKVAIQVPCYNEPASLVTATLDRLRALDYPADRFVIMVADDSTRPEAADPIRDYCARHGLHYLHRADRRGYKAGALNALLRQTPADVELIAVVDADYHVEPEFLRETVGYFADPGLAWLQTPQDYRNRHQSFLTEQYYIADAYFYRTVLPSRNEENSIIFCGTMGMLRKRALVESGGWNESCITEDAELSVRLLNAGWRSLYINRTYGRGLIPGTFAAYKGQHYRWAFGGGRILRLHGLRLLFGRFTFRQRLDFLLGALNWFEGAFLLVLSLFVLAVGVADALGSEVVTHHAQEIQLVGLVPLLLLLDGLTRVHLVLRRRIHLGFGGTLRMLAMWWSVKFSNARAAAKGLLGFSMAFLRTRKSTDPRLSREASLRRALGLTPFESTMAAAFVATAVAVVVHMAVAGTATTGAFSARVFLVFWLLYYALLFGAAPLYAYKSFVTIRPDPETHAVAETPKEVNA